MLSVLIATYNFNTVPLVKEIQLQLSRVSIPYEIICFDDASKSDFNTINQTINNIVHCTFIEHTKNLGRSKNRNLLAKTAKYDWLLFLDGDVLPVNNLFIKNYVALISTNNNKTYTGGIAYKNNETKHLLRYKFGKRSEVFSAFERNKNPEEYFFSSNFLISKSSFNQIEFNEDLLNYGYEDLLFAKKLNQKGIQIKHIDNQVYHLGIDTNEMFLAKSKKAVENLVVLIGDGLLNKNDTKISKFYFKIKPFGLIPFLSLFENYFKNKAVKSASLFCYDVYRLIYLHRVFKNSK